MTREEIHTFLHMMGVTNIRDRDDWVSASCPFAPWKHTTQTDNHPSFGIKIGESVCKCFTCNSIMNLSRMVATLAQYTNQDHLDLHQFILSSSPNKCGHTPRAHILSIMTTKQYAAMFSPFTDPYRGLKKETITDWGLALDRERNRLVIPIRDAVGRIVGIKGRALGEETPRYLFYSDLFASDPKGCGVWYGMDKVNLDKPVLLVEGEMDMLLGKQLGLNILSSMGASITRLQIEYLLKMKNKIIIYMDGDTAGIGARDYLVKKLKGVMPLYEVKNHYGLKDIGEAIKVRKVKEVLATIDRVT